MHSKYICYYIILEIPVVGPCSAFLGRWTGFNECVVMWTDLIQIQNLEYRKVNSAMTPATAFW